MPDTLDEPEDVFDGLMLDEYVGELDDVLDDLIDPVLVGDELDVFVSLGLADVVLDTSIDLEG